MSWLKIKKSVILKYCLLLFYAMTVSHFLIGLWRVTKKKKKMDFIWQPEMTSWVVGLRRSSKALPKAKLAPKKKSWSLFGGLLPVWSTKAFWIPEKPLHMRSMLSTSTRCIKAAMPVANIAQQKGPNSSPWQHLNTDCTTNISKLSELGYEVLLSPITFTWPLANWLPLLQASWQLFAEKMFPQPAGGRKCFPRAHQILKHGFFATGVNKFVSLWQKYVDCNGSYFD